MPEVPIPAFERSRRRTRVYDSDRDNMAEVVEAIRANLVPPGSLQQTLARNAPDDGGWLMMDGSWHAKAEYPRLLGALRLTFPEMEETEDMFRLPDLSGYIGMGTGGPGAPSLGAFGGAHERTLTVDQMPTHDHGVTDPGHSHGFQGAPHSHNVTDPGHSHGLTETEHTHTISDPGHTHTAAGTSEGAAAAGSDVAAALDGETGSSTTGVTVDPATVGGTVDEANTGVTVGDATAGGTVEQSTTGLSINKTGGGQAFQIVPPVVGVNWMVKT